MWYEIFRFELKYRVQRWDTYIYFALLFGYSIIAIDFIYTESLVPVKRNAPFIIAKIMGIVTALFTMLTSMIMGMAGLRDFDHNMETLLFVTPIKKWEYLGGRFLGAFTVLLFTFCALPLGLILGNYMPWRVSTDLLPFAGWTYIQPFLSIVLPNLFFTGVLFFMAGALSRKLLVVYTQGILLLVAYLITLQLVESQDNAFWAALLDPFSFQTVGIVTQFWTVVERNSQFVPLENWLLFNRIIWIILGLLILIIGYWAFSFDVVRKPLFKRQNLTTTRLKKQISSEINDIKIPKIEIRQTVQAELQQLLYHSLFYFKSILKETSFWAIVICAAAIIFINSISLDTTYGIESYPLTYIIVEELKELSIFFFLIILIFFSGELIWKERAIKIAELYDILPISSGIQLTSKLIGLCLTYLVLLLTMILAGILFQTFKGYYHYELSVYLSDFLLSVFPTLVLFTILSFFIQVLVNHKFLGHFLVIVFIFLAILVPQVLGFNHGLYTFGGMDLSIYSDMNGYGHSWWPFIWFKIYWFAFAILLFIGTILLSVRGKEIHLKKRLKSARFHLTPRLIKVGTDAILIFLLSGTYIFYNTNILNEYATPSTQATYRVNYEKTLKKFQDIPQPKIVSTDLKVDLFPSERNYVASGHYTLVNPHSKSISSIHIQKMPSNKINLDSVSFSKTAILNDTFLDFAYYLYELEQPLKSGDSITMEFQQTYTTKGFSQDREMKIVNNGTFFDNIQLPSFGYNHHIELQADDDRIDYGLSLKSKLSSRENSEGVKESKTGEDSKIMNFEMVISTDTNQIAVAPGVLQKKWVADNRNYFHYKTAAPIINFYPIVTAEYEVFRDKWVPKKDNFGQAIDLEIYHHPSHTYNLDRMMQSMQHSYDYFTKNFSPFPYQQMCIVEVPRYVHRAQSFPTIIAYSESMGFIMDVKAEDLDMPFFITAHEVAHQWWGIQVPAANVKGKKMLLESLAQYSALMVFQQKFGEEKTLHLLAQDREKYLKGRAMGEVPLGVVDDESYIYYRKGILNLYALQDYISEDSVNIALQRFIKDWNSFDGKLATKRYATSKDLLGYFEVVTPDSLQYLKVDLFEKIILYEQEINNGSFEKSGDNKYEISLEIAIHKFQSDSLGEEIAVPLNDWINIGVYGGKPNQTSKLIHYQKHKISTVNTKLNILVYEKPSKVIIDPKNLLITKEHSNKRWDFEE